MDTPGEISVEGIVRRVDEDTVLFKGLFPLKGGSSHGNPERFGFFRAGNDAAIIIREDDDGFVP